MQFNLWHGRATAIKIWKSYERQLSRRPIRTQMTTSLLLWGVGDLTAQKIVEQRKQIDGRRLGLTGAFGAAFMGPIGHYWYIGLDWFCAQMFSSGSKKFLAAKILLDSVVLTPIYVLAFYAWGAVVMDGTGWKGFKDKTMSDFLPTFAAEMGFWPLFQCFNFTRIPLEHQLLAVNLAMIFDASFLSWTRAQDDWLDVLMKYLPNNPPILTAAAAAAAQDNAPAPLVAKSKKTDNRNPIKGSEKNER